MRVGRKDPAKGRGGVSSWYSAATIFAIVTLGTGCSSTTQLDSIEAQLADIQRQLLQIQQDSASGAGLDAARSELTRQLALVVQTQADSRQDASGLIEKIERLDAAVEDLRFRLSQVSQQLSTANEQLKEARTAPVARPDVGLDPQTLYRAAYDDYLRSNFDLAILAFGQYLERYPATDLADNAAYWIGESHFRLARYRDSITAFDRVLADFPRSDKTASALLKKGYALLELGERSQAVVHLQSVLREHPTSDEASLAKQRLSGLGLDISSGSR